jgi:hypothetical protein
MSVTDIPSFDPRDHPRTRTGLLTATVVSVLLVVAIRIAVAPLIDDPVNSVTYVGVIGGIIGAAAVQWVTRWTGLGYPPSTQFWSEYLGDGDPGEYLRQGMYMHLLYGAVAGGCYPRLFWLLGIRVDLYGTLPWSLAIGLAFGLLAFVLAIVLVALDAVAMDITGKRVAALLSLHIVYGLVVGAVVGLYLPDLAGVL